MTESKPSKSARKRVQHELQALGEQLIGLSDAELAALPLDERLVEAVRSARGMTSHEALRRQKQLIGKLMRGVDAGPVRARLLELRGDDQREKRLFRAAETWRDTIVQQGAAGLAAFEQRVGMTDAQLHSLLSQLEIASSDRAATTVRRNIFRRVREILGRIPG